MGVGGHIQIHGHNAAVLAQFGRGRFGHAGDGVIKGPLGEG